MKLLRTIISLSFILSCICADIADSATYVNGLIGEDTTWSLAGSPYILDGNVEIPSGVTLSIEPGVSVELGGRVLINVYGTLNATGVTFTWEDGLNQWDGIRFSGSGASGSRLEGCVIEHAEGHTHGAIIYIFESSPTITDCTIHNSNAFSGIIVETSTSSPSIINNTIDGMTMGGIDIWGGSNGTYQDNTLTNNDYGIYVDYAGGNNPALSGNTYSNNNSSGLVVGGMISSDVSWDDTQYTVWWLTIENGGRLTIPPGRTVRFQQDAMLDVHGTLNATGVTFTWEDGLNQWDGIRFSGSGASGSRLEGCVIEHADNPSSLAVIYIFQSSPTIIGCTIHDSNAFSGIIVSDSSPSIINNTIDGMTMGGIDIWGGSNGTYQGNMLTNNNYGIYVLYEGSNNPLLNGNTYSGNNTPGLMVDGVISTDMIWDETQYTISWLVIGNGGSLTISPGGTVRFQPDGELDVRGTLNARGVTFTWNDGMNQWEGMTFFGAGASNSRLEDCVIEHAKGNPHGAIIDIINSSPTITGCTIHDSNALNGIVVSNGSPSITNCTIEGMTVSGINIGRSNGTYQNNILTNNYNGIYVDYLYGNNPLLSRNSYSGNSISGLMVTGIISTDVTWDDTQYTVDWLAIANGGKLTISPGRTVRLMPSAMIEVNGTLNARDVTFTWEDGVYQWDGIAFFDGGASSSRLEDCVIEHAEGFTFGAIIVFLDSSPSITGCTISNCYATRGIYMHNSSAIIRNNAINGMNAGAMIIGNNSSPEVTGNTFSQNGDCGIIIDSSVGGLIEHNTISGNTCGLLNRSGVLIEAINNDWGHASGPLDDSDDRASGGLYNPFGLGNTVSDLVNYYPWTGMTDSDQDMYPLGMDCNDNDPIINPDTYWHTDSDGDGFGNQAVSIQQCVQPAGYVLDNTDCDDNDRYIYPGGPAARIAGAVPLYFNALQSACDAADDNSQIESKAGLFSEDLYFDLGKSVVLEGGMDCGYKSITGTTTINGSITITSGIVIIGDFLLGP